MQGNLYDLISENEYNEKACQFIIYKTLLSLKCLHDIGVIHRNVKSKNVLWNKKGDVKLCNLSSAAYLTEENNARLTVKGEILFQAPELITTKNENE
jgi:serine/threonine protein kinase